MKIVTIGLLLFLMTNVTCAYGSYGDIYTYEVYFNDNLLPGTEVAEPTLKIGEPFTVRVDVTVYQKSDVYVNLAELGENNFKIIDGPTSQMGRYSDGDVCETNSTHKYEWTVSATENWADGSLPLNFHYTILEHGNPEPLVNSGFTVAYPYISTEYYEDKNPISISSDTEPTSESAPAFTTFGTFLALALVAFHR